MAKNPEKIEAEPTIDLDHQITRTNPQPELAEKPRIVITGTEGEDQVSKLMARARMMLAERGLEGEIVVERLRYVKDALWVLTHNEDEKPNTAIAFFVGTWLRTIDDQFRTDSIPREWAMPFLKRIIADLKIPMFLLGDNGQFEQYQLPAPQEEKKTKRKKKKAM